MKPISNFSAQNIFFPTMRGGESYACALLNDLFFLVNNVNNNIYSYLYLHTFSLPQEAKRKIRFRTCGNLQNNKKYVSKRLETFNHYEKYVSTRVETFKTTKSTFPRAWKRSKQRKVRFHMCGNIQYIF
jgi:hypothetical protein